MYVDTRDATPHGGDRARSAADLAWAISDHLYDGGKPAAFVAWAQIPEAVEARLDELKPKLAPADWRSGDRIWLVSMIAPFGHGEKALEDVTVNALAGKSFKFHRRLPDGRNVVETVGTTSMRRRR